MKMEPEILREILLQVEAYPAGKSIYRFKYEGATNVEIMEHVQLLIDADMVEGKVVRAGMSEPVKATVHRLTFGGHQFLAKARNDTIWKKVVAQAKEKGMSTSMVVINGLLESAAKKYAGLD